MIDRWFDGIELPLTFEEFRKLPTNAAYKYEYFNGKAWLSPRPKSCHALLELRPREDVGSVEASERVTIRPLSDADWEALVPLFAAAFHRVPPFASLGDTNRGDAARECLQFTREGGDGPLIGPASFAAVAREDDGLCGAILTTLMPDLDLEAAFNLRWKEPPPPDCLERQLGRPHLTWIFVSPWFVEHGVGSALLAAANNGLLDLGYGALASTFLVGNHASALWHWRNGFRLVGRPYSLRRIRSESRRREPPAPDPDPGDASRQQR